MWWWRTWSVLAFAACASEEAGRPEDAGGPGSDAGGALVVHLGEVVDGAGEGRATLAVEQVGDETRVEIDLGAEARIVEVAVTFATEGTATFDGETVAPEADVAWFRPRPGTAQALWVR